MFFNGLPAESMSSVYQRDVERSLHRRGRHLATGSQVPYNEASYGQTENPTLT